MEARAASGNAPRACTSCMRSNHSTASRKPAPAVTNAVTRRIYGRRFTVSVAGLWAAGDGPTRGPPPPQPLTHSEVLHRVAHELGALAASGHALEAEAPEERVVGRHAGPV